MNFECTTLVRAKKFYITPTTRNSSSNDLSSKKQSMLQYMYRVIKYVLVNHQNLFLLLKCVALVAL